MNWLALVAALVGLPATGFVTGAVVEAAGQVSEWARSRRDPSSFRSSNPLGDVLGCALQSAGIALAVAFIFCALALIWWPLLAAVRWAES